MIQRIKWGLTLRYAIIEAIFFCIPVILYIHDESYRQTWLLFLGSFFFMIVTVFHTIENSRKRSEVERTTNLIFTSLVITVVAIILSCLISFILLSVMVPGYLGSGPAEKALTDAPPNTLFDKTNGMSNKIFLTAVVANFSVGAFVGLLIPFYSTRNREGVSGELFPLKDKAGQQ